MHINSIPLLQEGSRHRGKQEKFSTGLEHGATHYQGNHFDCDGTHKTSRDQGATAQGPAEILVD